MSKAAIVILVAVALAVAWFAYTEWQRTGGNASLTIAPPVPAGIRPAGRLSSGMTLAPMRSDSDLALLP